MKSFRLIPFLILIISKVFSQPSKPTFEDVIGLSSIWSPIVSNDGNTILYEVQKADWEKNRFDTEIFQLNLNGKQKQLTDNKDGSSYAPKLSLDGKWLAYFSDSENGTDLVVLNRKTSKKSLVPQLNGSITYFKWHPTDSKLVVLFRSLIDDEQRLEGNYEIEDEYNARYSLIGFQIDKEFQQEILLSDIKKQINEFDISFDGKLMAVEHQIDSRSISGYKTDISIIDLKTKQPVQTIANLGWDGLISWSPNSYELLYHTYFDNTDSDFYKNVRLEIYSYDSKKSKPLAQKFDENIYEVVWTQAGIFGLVQIKTDKRLIKIDPKTNTTSIIQTKTPYWSVFSTSANGEFITYVAGNQNDLPELFVTDSDFHQIKRMSNMTSQIDGWVLPKSEIFTWRNSKGQTIEGVLRKPANFGTEKSYPVLTVVHGGPKATSWPEPVPTSIYPINQWAQEDVIIFQPNYRGSSGYGELFRSGLIGDFGDVVEDDILSGLNALSKTIKIDQTKLGIMGWSFGGFISAYLSVKSNKFKAASVGAGITDWKMQYYSTDEHLFPIQYLKATPWKNEEIYNMNSPMHYISKANTPTLIQHGENDRRVPIANALALYQGLEDNHIPVKLITYKGFGHRIVKPVERLAALKHNYHWFDKYLNLDSEKNLDDNHGGLNPFE